MKTPNTKIALAAAGILLCAASSLSAAGYSTAEITRTFNDVKVLKEGAAPKSGSPGTRIDPVTSVATGADSRAELRFPDKSLTRLGANSRFTLRGDARNLDLNEGVMMLQVPKGVGGAKVRTAAVTAAVTGTTVMFEYQPDGQGDGDGFMKVICIEGSLDLSLNEDPSTFQTIKAGQLSLTKLGSGLLGAPVDVDLKLLLKTSKLLNEGEDTPNSGEVSQAVQTQQKELTAGTLVQTNLVIPGRGNIVIVDTIGNILNNLGFLVQGPPPPPPPVVPGVVEDTPPPVITAPFQGFLPLIAGRTILGDGEGSEVSTLRPTPHVTAFNLVQGQITSEGRQFLALIPFSVYGFGKATTDTQAKFNEFMTSKVFDSENGAPWAAFKFEELFINGTPSFLTGTGSLSFIGSGEETEVTTTDELPPILNVVLASQKDIRVGTDSLFETPVEEGGGEAALPPPGYEGPYNTLDLSYSDLDSFVLYSQNGHITIRSTEGDNAIYGNDQSVQIVAAGLTSDVLIQGNIVLDGSSSLLGLVAGRDVVIASNPGGNLVNVEAGSVNIDAGNDVKVNKAVVNAHSGNLIINAKNKITIENSSQLKALMDLTLTSAEGGIEITDSSLDAPGRTIWLNAKKGNITLDRVKSPSLGVAACDVFKAHALGTGANSGWIHIKGNSSITANQTIELFGNMATGGVSFEDNTTLDAQNVNIKGHTVQILGPDTQVTITKGTLNVDATNHNYKGYGKNAQGYGTFIDGRPSG